MLPLVPLLRPFRALPLGESRYLALREPESIERAEKATVPWPAAQTDPVNRMTVIETGIFGLGSVYVTIMGMYFLPNFWD